ncbi:FG-GAP-like repeat-containing protein [Hymenobacter lucidus]|uniref:T9SS type A sorting domain-containing protein n=1 Tax=Hymenobacter lucidus TaxID=2880930 RepID=A0ABS8AVB4_9BACT|nr:FG-GAP-like repeat-containing protein [Hymenobacter lucidus]MCB2409366.1 T9SS type A sorting domain-containing protein [Hymenobacter lucidus]
MKSFYHNLSALILLIPSGAVLAQAPLVTNVIPAANARAAARTGLVMATFSQPLTSASAAALKVFSNQRGGLRTTAAPAVVSGNTLSFMPAPYAFLPGETVHATITTAAASAEGALATPRVLQFTTAVGGTGSGNFEMRSRVPAAASNIVLGDIDGDGDLDAVGPNELNAATILLNDGMGNFAAPPTNATVATGGSPYGLALGDIDGDGDLDCVTANASQTSTGGSSSVRFNNGSGVFTAPTVGAEVPVPVFQRTLVLADLDGDGDLDLLTGGSIRLNNGAGLFTAPVANAEITGVARDASGFAVGDVDGDGDLDMTITDFTNTSGKVNILFNNGAAVFAVRPTVPSPAVGPYATTLGDVDGDGDLDLLVIYMTRTGNNVSLFLNNGTGVFGNERVILLGSPFWSNRNLALGDLDADGDLDLLLPLNDRVSVMLNNGAGMFSSPAATVMVSAGFSHVAVTSGDLDADGDLDFVGYAVGYITTCVNQPITLASAAANAAPAFSMYPNPARDVVTVSGVAPRATLEVLDALGRLVATATANATGTAQLTLSAAWAPGVYVVQSEGRVQRLVVE